MAIAVVMDTPALYAGARIDQIRSSSGVTNPVRPSTGIIIKYKSDVGIAQGLSSSFAGQNAAGLGFSRASAAANRLGITLLFDKPLATGGYLLKQSAPLNERQLRELLQEIAADPAVEYVEPDAIMRPLFVPNDSFFGSQWHYQNTSVGVKLPAAWPLANGGGVRVAVLDTGITSHPDLNANVIGGYDFVSADLSNDGDGPDPDPSDPGDWGCGYPSSWHGTHVAGTIAAVTNNGFGVAGVAFGAQVVPVRVLGTCGGYVSDIANGMVWAAGGAVGGAPANPHPARVINLSLGGYGSCSNTFQNAIDLARSRGATVVVAAGNSNDNLAFYQPASCNGVISVAATSQAGSKAGFSNFGATMGLSAPGENVLSTLNSGTTVPGSPDYALYAGTSMAAPHVAGVAALVLQQNPTFTPNEVAARIKLGSTTIPGTCTGCGAGLLSAYGALVPPTSDVGTVFRFFNARSGIHLFTSSPVERDHILGAIPEFMYERPAFKVQSQPGNGSLPVYRFRNQHNGAYFFTISEAEKNAVLQHLPNFVLEGIVWWARSTQTAGTIPLYRFRRLSTGSHFYSYSAFEAAHIRSNLASEYADEGIGFYVWPL